MKKVLHCSGGAVTTIRRLEVARGNFIRWPNCPLANYPIFVSIFLHGSSIKILRNFVTTTAHALQFLHLYY
jgi:hypothetical protein